MRLFLSYFLLIHSFPIPLQGEDIPLLAAEFTRNQNAGFESYARKPEDSGTNSFINSSASTAKHDLTQLDTGLDVSLQDQTEGLMYSHQLLSVEDGLAARAVLCGLQDQRGFLWLGTRNGLNRFDGEKFILMTRRDGLQRNRVVGLVKDKVGNIWISYGSKEGTNQTDGRTDIFNPVSGELVPIEDKFPDIPFNLGDIQLWGCNDLSVTTSTAVGTGVSNTTGAYISMTNQIDNIISNHWDLIRVIDADHNLTEQQIANEIAMQQDYYNAQFVNLLLQYNTDLEDYQIAFGLWTFNGQVGPPPVAPTYPALPVYIPGPPPIYPAAPNPCPAGLGVMGTLQTSDWSLPSKDELNLMYTNLHLGSLGSFSPNNYWSSSQLNITDAFMQNFSNGTQSNADKSTTQKVRLVKTF